MWLSRDHKTSVKFGPCVYLQFAYQLKNLSARFLVKEMHSSKKLPFSRLVTCTCTSTTHLARDGPPPLLSQLLTARHTERSKAHVSHDHLGQLTGSTGWHWLLPVTSSACVQGSSLQAPVPDADKTSICPWVTGKHKKQTKIHQLASFIHDPSENHSIDDSTLTAF